MKMSNKTYDLLIWISQVVLPALGTLYAGLAYTWSLPYGEQIVGTIMLLDAFLGTILKISNSKYNKSK